MSKSIKMKDLLKEALPSHPNQSPYITTKVDDGSPISSTTGFKKNEAKKWLNSFLKTTRMDFEFIGNSKLILRDDIHSVELSFGPLSTEQ